MGGKIMGIVLLVVGAGLALYFYSSGGFAKFGTVLKPPSNGTSTTSATATTTLSVAATTTASSTVAATSSNPFINFLNELFHPNPEVTGPTVGVGSSGGGSNYNYETGSSGNGSGSGSNSKGGTNSANHSTASIPTD